MSQVRVRFAPSPTGFFHIGSARTALFNWLYARHTEGVFVLRIEDTDKERNTEEALQVLLEGMRWLGLNWDEGPEVGGDFGPYFQSERGAIYEEYLEKLNRAGRTYEKDGAVWFRLEGERYTEFDPHLKKEVEKVKTAPMVIQDAVRGRVERREEKDFVLIRQNGEPVFHFVNVVDDIAMGITHVIRGEDHLSNTSKHCELYRAFGVEAPEFAHIPLILKASGPGKMSKRDEGSLIEDYQKRHFLPEALRNYLCLLGWSPKDDREVLNINEIIQIFDLPQISKNNARFDEQKLSFINTEYLRLKPLETFSWLARPILHESGVIDESYPEDQLQKVLELCQPKIRSLEETPSFVYFFFKDDFEVNEKAARKVLKKGDPAERLKEFEAGLALLEVVDAGTVESLVEKLSTENGVGTGSYIQPVRLAVSGTNVGPAFYELIAVLGQDTVLKRIRKFRSEQF
jgi:glutamyl-tRNA synthetase